MYIEENRQTKLTNIDRVLRGVIQGPLYPISLLLRESIKYVSQYLKNEFVI